MESLRWIGVDASGDGLTIWLISEDGSVLDQVQTGEGALEDAVLHAIGGSPERPVTVLVCGLNTDHWTTVPAAPPIMGSGTTLPTSSVNLNITALPGLRQSAPVDMVLGAETRVAGVLATLSDFDGVICLAEDPSAWVHVSAGEIVSFRSFLTLELAGKALPKALNETVFDDAVDRTMSRPAGLAADLASARAEARLAGHGTDLTASRTLGHLIGAELAAAKPYWLGQEIVLVGADPVAAAYARALAPQGLSPRLLDRDEMTLAGLRAAFVAG